MFKSVALGVVFGVGLLSAPVSAQMQPVSAENLGEAVGACINAVDGAGTIEEELLDLGWSFATAEPELPADIPFSVLATEGNEAWIMTAEVNGGEPDPCIVLARLSSTDRYHPSVEGLSGAIGMPVSRDENLYFWRFSNKIAQMAPTGSAEKPGLRFTVMKTGDN